MSVRTVLSRRILEPEIAAKLWRIYALAFGKASEEAVQDQMCYTEATLAQALADPDYAKFVVERDGEPIGFGLVTNDMDKARVAYVNPGYLKAKLPEEYAARRLHYFTAIAVLPELQGQKAFFASMASEMTAYIDGVDGIVLFDFSMETTSALPMLLERAIRAAQKERSLKTDGTEYRELGGQRYGMIRFTKS